NASWTTSSGVAHHCRAYKTSAGPWSSSNCPRSSGPIFLYDAGEKGLSQKNPLLALRTRGILVTADGPSEPGSLGGAGVLGELESFAVSLNYRAAMAPLGWITIVTVEPGKSL